MRTLFPKGKQREFIDKILLKVSIKDFAKICNISERTVRDWRREKFLSDLDSLKKISNKFNIKIPSNIELKDDYWYVVSGSSAGAKAVYEKYGRYFGNPEYRRKRWYEWWEKEGKHKNSLLFREKSIKKPQKSTDLAEFVGIILGDGSIGKSQISITLHSEDDKEYGDFVTKLIKKLFNVYIGIHHRKDSKAISYNVSRTELIRFCTEKLGLKQGNKVKQQVDIPDWVKKDRQYSIACVRGLVDTDGCVFTHRYKVSNRFYDYKKLSFTNHSYPLRKSVFDILKYNGLNPRFVKTKEDIRLDSISDMQKYFKIFSSHNPKHLKRLKN